MVKRSARRGRRRAVRPVDAVRRSAVLGVLAGLAVVAVVWGAAMVWGPSGGRWVDGLRSAAGQSPGSADAAGPSAGADDADAADDADGLGAGSLTQPLEREPGAGASSSPSPSPSSPPSPPSPSPSPAAASPTRPSPPVPVRATVAYEIASRGAVVADLDDFAARVAKFLADPKGWPAAGVEFKQVAADGLITIWLVEDSQVPSFSSICSTGLSCSIGRNIIINQTRWLESAPAGVMDHVPLEDYRMMVVNHEVGHWLGHHNHSSCPGVGEIAPLMMQQSKGLNGCVFNPYPLPSELTAPDLFK
jgi:hypothetical protein